MKNIKFICLLSLITAFSACRNSGRNARMIDSDSLSVDTLKLNNVVLPPLEPGLVSLTDDAFGETIDLYGEPLQLKENTKPEQIIVKDNYLITNNQRQDSVFMIFELSNMKCIAAFGIKGNGPGEFGFPRIIETAEDSILFYIYEQMSEKIYKVTRNKFKPEYYLTLQKQNRSFDDKQIVFIDSKNAFYSASTAKGKMIYSFHKDSIPQERGIKDLKIPGVKGSWSTLIGDFGINSNKERIAYAYKYFKRLRIIDLSTMGERDIVFKAKALEKGLNDVATLEPTNITHFWGMSANEDYFWMLYSGRTPVDVVRDNQNKKKYIYVEKYDWNGNPVKRYKLDDWGYFCVDKMNKTLFLASTAGINSILKYKLQ